VDHEILSPLVPDDLRAWVALQLQFSAGTPMGLPDVELNGGQLTFLFAVVDAYKAAFAASLQRRGNGAGPLVLSAADVMEADLDGRREADRRFLVRTMAELFAHLVRPGGRQGVALPVLDEATVTSEISRYAARGFVELVGSAGRRNPTFILGPSLGMMAGSLFSWISVLSLHDVQVTDWQGRPLGQEELLVYVVTEPAVWALVSSGLTAATDSVADVRFAFRALSRPDAERLAARFTAPAEVSLSAEVYAPIPVAVPTAPSPVPAPVPTTTAAAGTAVAPATSRSESPKTRKKPADQTPATAPVPTPAAASATPTPWAPSHRVPTGGMSAWERPDPQLAPVAELDEGLEVQLLEETTGWGHILCSNGWQAWVDARYLEALR
jgi:hypothetical protein